MAKARRGFTHSNSPQARRTFPRFMPIKLQVVKEDAEDDEPADYLFEQDRITIGRGSTNDLTLPDQKVSKEHAEIRSDGGGYMLLDRDSKNNTYVNGQQVGETEPYVLQSGDIFQVGDFRVEFAPLFMPSSEQTAFAEQEDEGNPFSQHAGQLASALEGLAETYRFAPPEDREAAFEEALHDAIDDTMDDEVVQGIVSALAADAGEKPDETTESGGVPDAVLTVLLESVSRVISIPGHFWREFTGNTLVHAPEKAFLHDGDLDALREHLLDASISSSERAERLEHLEDAVDTLVAHNMALLAGYKASVRTGSEALLEQMDPNEAEAASGVMDGIFGGGGEGTELGELKSTWRALMEKGGDTLERELFRPTYVETYVDQMADTWDMEQADLMPGADAA